MKSRWNDLSVAAVCDRRRYRRPENRRRSQSAATVCLAIAAVVLIAAPGVAQAPTTPFGYSFTELAADEARDLHNLGQLLFDQGKFRDAERRFREVIRKFPKNEIAPKSDYYLMRSLVRLGKKNEALDRAKVFTKAYPGSSWYRDVQDLVMSLTTQPTPAELARLQVTPQAPPAPPAPPAPNAQTRQPSPPAPIVFTGAGPVIVAGQAPTPRPDAALRPSRPNSSEYRPGQVRVTDPEVSLQQEILRAVFRNNADRAIDIAAERLRTDPADPVVLSNLHMVAESTSTKALPMLTNVVRTSTNPNARRDAIYFISRARGEKDALADVLVTLVPNLRDEEIGSVAHALSVVNNDKSMSALAGLARDRNRTEKTRTEAIYWIGQSKVANRATLLDDIYRGSTDNVKIRIQVAYALSQSREPQAVKVLGTIAQNDPSLDVRRQAVYYLGEIKTPEAFVELENLLKKR